MLWKGSQVPRSLGNIRKRTKTRPWRKRQSKSLKFSFHKYFTTCFYLFLFFNYFTLSFFFYTFFTHDIYPHPHPWPATHTHDPRPLPTTHDPRHLATLLAEGLWSPWISQGERDKEVALTQIRLFYCLELIRTQKITFVWDLFSVATVLNFVVQYLSKAIPV